MFEFITAIKNILEKYSHNKSKKLIVVAVKKQQNRVLPK
jgi:hypothetical protein